MNHGKGFTLNERFSPVRAEPLRVLQQQAQAAEEVGKERRARRWPSHSSCCCSCHRQACFQVSLSESWDGFVATRTGFCLDQGHLFAWLRVNSLNGWWVLEEGHAMGGIGGGVCFLL